MGPTKKKKTSKNNKEADGQGRGDLRKIRGEKYFFSLLVSSSDLRKSDRRISSE